MCSVDITEKKDVNYIRLNINQIMKILFKKNSQDVNGKPTGLISSIFGIFDNSKLRNYERYYPIIIL